MNEREEKSTIVWKLPCHQKGRYVAAARAAGLSLIAWLEKTCNAASTPVNPPAGKPRDDGE